MATAADIAAYILAQCGPMTAMKLQKLVYYSQAWHLAWDEVPLFDDPIEAWANGPVVRSLYMQHRGRFQVAPGEIEGDPSTLAENEMESVNVVVGDYCHFEPYQLSELTHREHPWIEAREGLSPGERGESVICQETMLEYYSGLRAR